MTVQVVDDADKPLPSGAEGLVRVSGPFNVKEYVNGAAETARAFRGSWFYSGDIGALTKDNLLIITGRQKTVMNIGGDKVKPEIIENVLTAFPAIDDAGVFSFANDYGLEEVWALIAAASDIDMTQLHIHCQGRLPPNFVPRRFMKVDALPKNEMGKLDRRRLQQLAQATQT